MRKEIKFILILAIFFLMKKEIFTKILSSNKYTIVEIYANYCPHCKFMKSIIEKLSLDYPEINFTSINTDNEEAIWINEEYKIDTIPRYLFFQGSRCVYEHEGSGPLHVFDFFIKTKLFEQKLLNMFDNGIPNENFVKLLKSHNKVVTLIYSDNSESMHILPYYFFLMNQFEEIYFLTVSSSNSRNLISIVNDNNIGDIKFPYFLLYKDETLINSFYEINQDVVRYLIAETLLDQPIKSYNGILEEDFQKALEINPLTILYIYKNEGDKTLSMKTQLFNFLEKYKDIHVGSLKYSKNCWLVEKLEITEDDYNEIVQFTGPIKKLPYFLFYKNGELVFETGPVDFVRFDDIIQDKLRDHRFW